jgi:hypothetical protein
MIKVLRDLFGGTPRAEPTKKRTAAVPSRQPDTGSAFRAVTLAPSLICCAAATRTTGKRVLLREAPRLPLPACTMPKECSCKFRKNPDRRDCDRRLFGGAGANRWFSGAENRKHGERRLMAM